ncbi:SRPBCC family protein [Pseudokineococcus sp. 1T1Z-3]|uniref:SRPBCC family protein n=1 Tax=Pseudokineococcus sp. 1T1Z-3 TaxID=3132745 RepID=UPI0030A78016
MAGPGGGLRLRLAAAGDATAQEAWDRYARTSRWSQWSPQVRSTSLPAHLASGAEGVVVGPLGLRVAASVGEVEQAARRWAWTVRLARPALPGVRLRLEHEVVARGSGCATSLVLDGPAPVVLGYALPARLAIGRLVRA